MKTMKHKKEAEPMDTRQITVKFNLPSKFKSLHELEMAIDAEG